MRRLLIVLIAVRALGGAAPAAAYPEFVRHGYFNCSSCHVSPAGGGALTPYGHSYAAEKLATWVRPGEERPLHGAAGDLPEWLVLGGNLRQIQTVTETARSRDGRWIAMQRDVEACLVLAPAWMCATGGLLPASVVDERHRYGLRKAQLRVDVGESLMLRAGRFFPRYGLMIANHTSPIRRGLGFEPGTETDQIEATYVSERLEASVTREIGRVVRFAGETEAGNDAFDPAVNATVATPLGAASRAGVSYRRKTAGAATEHVAGVFAAVSTGEASYVLAEVDQRATVARTPAAGAPRITRRVVSHLKAGHELTRGVVPYLLHEVDFKDLRDGATRSDTYGLGLQWYPRPHLELDAFAGHVLQRRGFGYATAAYLLLHYYL